MSLESLRRDCSVPPSHTTHKQYLQLLYFPIFILILSLHIQLSYTFIFTHTLSSTFRVTVAVPKTTTLLSISSWQRYSFLLINLSNLLWSHMLPHDRRAVRVFAFTSCHSKNNDCLQPPVRKVLAMMLCRLTDVRHAPNEPTAKRNPC